MDQWKNIAWKCFPPIALFLLFRTQVSQDRSKDLTQNGDVGTGCKSLFPVSSTRWLFSCVLQNIHSGITIATKYQTHDWLLRTGFFLAFLCSLLPFFPSILVLSWISIKWQFVSRQLILETSNCWNFGNMYHEATNKVIRTWSLGGDDYLLFYLGKSYLTSCSKMLTSATCLQTVEGTQPRKQCQCFSLMKVHTYAQNTVQFQKTHEYSLF